MKTLTMEFDFSHAPAKVWRALTEAELVSKWLMNTDMKPSPGQSFTFSMPPVHGWDGVVRCQMKEVEPEKRLRYSWESMGLPTDVTWTLAPSAKGTRVRLEQSGFPEDPSQARYFEGAKMGWEGMAGKRLPDVLAQLG
jgi:uncharacterized protein YndB with AHSA1/START domain